MEKDKLFLAMNAGARAIEHNKRLQGSRYIWDVFNKSGEKSEISYQEAAEILRIQSAEILALKQEVERLRASIPSCGCQYCLDGIDIIQIKFPTTHEYGGTWWKESVRTPKYCPMCGHRLPEPLKGESE